MAGIGMAAVLSQAVLAQPALSSLYTDLSAQACRVVEADDSVSYTESHCPGVAGHHLRWMQGDDREELAVLTPDGQDHALKLMAQVSAAFSHLGGKAEWRMAGAGPQARPVALIVRYTVVADPVMLREVSYLVVAKITPSRVCLTDVIRPQAQANVLARQQADRAAGAPCLAP